MAFQTSLWTIISSSLWVLGAAAQSYSISNYSAVGTGCPKGTVYGTVSANGQGLTFRYSAFTASVNANSYPSDSRKNCQATVTVKVPPGYQFSFNRFTYDGKYALQEGVKSTYETYYYFQATLPQGEGSGTINGAASDNGCTLSHAVPAVWSACGQDAIVGIDSSVVTTNGPTSAAGSLTLQSLYIPPTSFNWRTC